MAGRLCEQPADVQNALASLRLQQSELNDGKDAQHRYRVIRAFAALASLWDSRLRMGWQPPVGSPFPWEQVRLSLAALLPGFSDAGDWLARSGGSGTPVSSTVTALVLAGNTPLLAWSPLAAALLVGYAVFVKQSRDETLWTRLFVESLAEVDAELASLIHLDLWPGEDARTAALVQSADAVIAYGSDDTLAALRSLVTNETPFFGFGHAVSIGVVAADGVGESGDFARDILLYNQSGCLSAQAVLVEEPEPGAIREVARILAHRLEQECATLQVPPVTDPAAARSVRQARDMALFLGTDVSVIGDPQLRWTVMLRSTPVPLELPVGSCIVQIVPLRRIEDDLPRQLGAMRGYVSSIGVAGTLSVSGERALISEGVSRICRAGGMQTPPLDWPNGNRNLLAELLSAMRNTETKGVRR